MSNPYQTFVASLARAVADAAALPKGGLAPAPQPALPADAPRALLLAPHPDDECIIGALPLRLRREAGMRVVNVAVTLGSNRARRPGRLGELEGACRFLGFELALPASDGLDRITPATRKDDPAHWSTAVDLTAALIKQHAPQVLIFPHAGDWNGTHIGTHLLAMDALGRLGTAISCAVVETEFWGAMTNPNLLVESSAADVGDLCAATSFHEGEVARNPYHVRLPAWMLDNVRRGGEVVGGQGGSAPRFTFATLYRLSLWKEGRLQAAPAGTPSALGAEQNAGLLFSGL